MNFSAPFDVCCDVPVDEVDLPGWIYQRIVLQWPRLSKTLAKDWKFLPQSVTECHAAYKVAFEHYKKVVVSQESIASGCFTVPTLPSPVSFASICSSSCSPSVLSPVSASVALQNSMPLRSVRRAREYLSLIDEVENVDKGVVSDTSKTVRKRRSSKAIVSRTHLFETLTDEPELVVAVPRKIRKASDDTRVENAESLIGPPLLLPDVCIGAGVETDMQASGLRPMPSYSLSVGCTLLPPCLPSVTGLESLSLSSSESMLVDASFQIASSEPEKSGVTNSEPHDTVAITADSNYWTMAIGSDVQEDLVFESIYGSD